SVHHRLLRHRLLVVPQERRALVKESRRYLVPAASHSSERALDHANVLRLFPFATGADVELDALPLLQGAVTVPLDVRVVDENVLAPFARDEAVALLGVEEFHCSSCQRTFSLSPRRRPFAPPSDDRLDNAETRISSSRDPPHRRRGRGHVAPF